jgi:hypothetical protein
VSASGRGYPVRCLAHVHSTHSDGTATMRELRAAVRRAEAEVLLLTDHDTLGARDAGEDGWGDGVLVVAGHEVSPHRGHLLVFGTDEVVPHAGRDERAILDEVQARGGFGYAAHPFSAGSAVTSWIGRPHPWDTFDHPALAGVEAWSLTTDAAESWTWPRTAWRALRDPVSVALAGPDPERLARWDALDDGRARAGLPPLAGLGGQDGHAPGVRVAGRVRSLLPHDRWMPLVQTVAVLDAPLTGHDSAADEARVLAALRAGRTAIVVPPLGDPLQVEVALDGTLEPPPGTELRTVERGRVRRLELWRPDASGTPRAWWIGSPVRVGG